MQTNRLRKYCVSCCLLAFSVHGQIVLADTTYVLNTVTGNIDGAELVSGRLVTDGTTGTKLRLEEILVDWEITISDQETVTLTPENSVVSNSGLNLIEFTVNSNGIFVEGVLSGLPAFRISNEFASYDVSNLNFFTVSVSAGDDQVSVSPLELPFAVSVGILGDINCDGEISLTDALFLLELLVTGTFDLKADINQDGVVNLLDVAPFVCLLTGG